MKKILIILLLLLFSLPAFGKSKNMDLLKKLSEIIYDESNISYIYMFDIFDKKYTCLVHNCYDYNSFRYNRHSKTSYIDMIIDLMYLNYQQMYPSPYGDGYISHLIFETSLHDDQLIIKCKGFVVSNIIAEYDNEKTTSMHYDIVEVYTEKPTSIDNIEELQKDFINWINVDSLRKFLKFW